MSPYERKRAELLIEKMYEAMKLPPQPHIIWCQSPWQLIMLPTLMPVLLSAAARTPHFAFGRNAACILIGSGRKKFSQCESAQDSFSPSLRSLWQRFWHRLESTCDSIRWSGRSLELGRVMIPEIGELEEFSSKFFPDNVQQLLMSDLRERINGGYHKRDSRMNGMSMRSQFFSALEEQLPDAFPRHLLSIYTKCRNSNSMHQAIDQLELNLSKAFFQSNLNFFSESIQFQAIGNQGCASIFFENYCFVLERPTFMALDSRERLSSDNGAAMVFNDGYDLHALEGILVYNDLIESPEWLTVERICDEGNQELRRLMLQRYGMDHFILDSDAKILGEDECGVLYSKKLDGEPSLTIVKVINSTPEPDGSFREYFLRVPPHMESARAAVAWTFGLSADEYGPVWQS